MAVICFSFFAELPKIAGGLDVEPKLGALFKKITEFEGHFRSNVAATVDDVVYASWVDAECSCKGVLRDAHGNEVVLKENFTGRDGGFHLENFAVSRQLLTPVVVSLPLKQISRPDAVRWRGRLFPMSRG